MRSASPPLLPSFMSLYFIFLSTFFLSLSFCLCLIFMSFIQKTEIKILNILLLFIAAAKSGEWYKGCYEVSLSTANTSLSVLFADPVDCGQTCQDKGYELFNY